MVRIPETDDRRTPLHPPARESSPSNASPFLARRPRWRGRGRKLILRSTAVLPAAFTLMNVLCGFGSIHFATQDAQGHAGLSNLTFAACLIFAAMACDMLDGRVARLTRRTSDFGGQLDSMADVVSFGVAPAMLMLRTTILVLRGNVERIAEPVSFPHVERIVWAIAAAYVACAALRLARFNVENQPDESAHLTFKGLPSPGAAAPIAALVLLFVELQSVQEGWRAKVWLLAVVSYALPILTLAGALLMVSAVRYPHVINQYLHTRRPFGYLVKLVIIVLAAVIEVFVTGAIVAVAFVLSGPAKAAWDRLRRTAPSEPAEGEPEAP